MPGMPIFGNPEIPTPHIAMKPKKVAILTAGGLAPCLSSAIGALIERYTEIDPSIEIICYRGGYKGLLLGDSITVTPAIRELPDPEAEYAAAMSAQAADDAEDKAIDAEFNAVMTQWDKVETRIQELTKTRHPRRKRGAAPKTSRPSP